MFFFLDVSSFIGVVFSW